MRTAYTAHQKPNSRFRRKAAARPAVSRTAATDTAVDAESRPDASGRNFFTGCARSRSRSATSLTMYTPLVITQKIAKPAAARAQPAGSPRAPPKRNSSGRTRFLTHWAGRAAARMALTTPPEFARGSAGVASPGAGADISVILKEWMPEVSHDRCRSRDAALSCRRAVRAAGL